MGESRSGFRIVTKKIQRGEDLNLYSFVRNNPINAVDPDGLKCVLMSNGMVYDTSKDKVVYWSSDPNRTAQFIAECNFRDKLPIIGACLILFGGGPTVPQNQFVHCKKISDDTIEGIRVCIFQCDDGNDEFHYGFDCDKSEYWKTTITIDKKK